MTALTIVVPCYNEQAVLEETTAQLLTVLERLQQGGKTTADSQLCFVDDGSTDSTWQCIERARRRDARVHGIKLSRNFGHQNALLAGLMTVAGDMVISIDADLQDDAEVMEQMVDAFNSGNDLVFGVRKDRSADSWLKRAFAESYYRLLRWMGIDAIFNHADFRLMSRRAIESLREFGEVNLYLRGVIPSLGFPTAIITYDRRQRSAGDSKYSPRKMLSLAANGITSFSVVPLRIISALGTLIFVGSLALSAWVAWVRFASPEVVPGWASSVLPMYFLGGVQLLSIGILGEYVAKIYMETKRRPRFVIERII